MDLAQQALSRRRRTARALGPAPPDGAALIADTAAPAPRSGGAATLVRRAAALFSVGVLGQLAGIGAGVVQAHTLGPAGKAVLAYAAVALAMALVGTDGLSNAVLLQAGRDKSAFTRIHAALTAVAATVGLPCLLVVAAIGFVFPSQRPLIGAGLAIPFALYAQGARGLLLAAGATNRVAWQGAIVNVFLNIAIVAVLLFAHVDVYAVLALWIAGQALAAAYTAVVVRATIAAHPSAPAGGPDVRSLVAEQFRFGVRASLATLAGFINMRIDIFLVSALLGAAALGVYTLAVGTGELLWNVSLPVVYASLESIAGGERREAAVLAARMMRIVVALQVTLGIVLFIAGPWLITLVYGRAFAEAGPIVRILAPGIVVYAVESFLGYYILVQIKRPLLIFWVQMTSAAVCAVITVLALPRFGMAGAAFATSVTYVAVVAFKSLYFRAKTGVGIREQWLLQPADLGPIVQRLRRRLRAA